jgi:hypothetical protein
MAFVRVHVNPVRFEFRPLAAEEMMQLGDFMCGVKVRRIKAGLNSEDSQAKPLKPGRNGRGGYPALKRKRGLQAVRDWTLTGRTLQAMKTLSASENSCTIGFDGSRANAIAYFNEKREPAFAASPSDRAALRAYLSNLLEEHRPLRRIA